MAFYQSPPYTQPAAANYVTVTNRTQLAAAINANVGTNTCIILEDGNYGVWPSTGEADGRINGKNGAGPTSRLIFHARNKGQAVFTGQGPYGAMLYIKNCNYLHFSGIKWTGTATWGVGIGKIFTPDNFPCSYISFNHCIFDGANCAEAVLEFSGRSSFFEVSDSEVIGGRAELFYCGDGGSNGSAAHDNSHDIVVRGNTFHADLTKAKGNGGGEAIDIKPNCYNVLIEHNHIYDVVCAHSGAIVVALNSGNKTWEIGKTNIVVRYNRVHNVIRSSDVANGTAYEGTSGIAVCAEGVECYGNVIWNMKVPGININRFSGSNLSETPSYIWNNTVHSTGGRASITFNTYGSWPTRANVQFNRCDANIDTAHAPPGSVIANNATMVPSSHFVGPLTGTADAGDGAGSGFRLAPTAPNRTGTTSTEFTDNADLFGVVRLPSGTRAWGAFEVGESTSRITDRIYDGVTDNPTAGYYPTPQAAIDAAQPGDRVLIRANYAHASGSPIALLVKNKTNLRILGQAADGSTPTAWTNNSTFPASCTYPEITNSVSGAQHAILIADSSNIEVAYLRCTLNPAPVQTFLLFNALNAGARSRVVAVGATQSQASPSGRCVDINLHDLDLRGSNTSGGLSLTGFDNRPDLGVNQAYIVDRVTVDRVDVRPITSNRIGRDTPYPTAGVEVVAIRSADSSQGYKIVFDRVRVWDVYQRVATAGGTVATGGHAFWIDQHMSPNAYVGGILLRRCIAWGNGGAGVRTDNVNPSTRVAIVNCDLAFNGRAHVDGVDAGVTAGAKGQIEDVNTSGATQPAVAAYNCLFSAFGVAGVPTGVDGSSPGVYVRNGVRNDVSQGPEWLDQGAGSTASDPAISASMSPTYSAAQTTARPSGSVLQTAGAAAAWTPPNWQTPYAVTTPTADYFARSYASGAGGSGHGVGALTGTAAASTVTCGLSGPTTGQLNTTLTHTDTGANATSRAWTVTNAVGATVATGTGSSLAWKPLSIGVHEVQLVVQGNGGPVTCIAEVSVVGTGPLAMIGGPSTVDRHTQALFSDLSSPTAGAITSRAWSVSGPNGFSLSGAAATFAFTPPQAGSYAVTLVVADEGGSSTATATLTVVVPVVPPTASFTGPTSLLTGAVATFTSTATAGVGSIRRRLWSATGPAGFSATSSTTTLTFTPAVAGSYTIIHEVTDDGATASTQRSLTVTVSTPPDTPTNPATSDLTSSLASKRRLGDGGEITVGLYAYGGRGGIHVIEGVGQDSHFTRTLSRPSTATISVPLVDASGGLVRRADGANLGDAWPWLTEIGIWWGGQLAWHGPVVHVKQQFDKMIIHAEDLSAWWERRDWEERDEDTVLTGEIVEILRTLHGESFDIEDEYDPIRRLLLQPYESGIEYELEVRAGETPMIADLIRRLDGLDWTVYGRQLFAMTEGSRLQGTRSITLTDNDYRQAPDYELRGDEYATDIVVIGSSAETRSRATNYTIRRNGPKVVRRFDRSWLTDTAATAAAAEALARRIGDIVRMDTIALSPDAAVSLNELIPGSLVEASMTTATRPVAFRGRIESVTVRFDGEVDLSVVPSEGG